MKILFSLISREICNIGAVKVQYCSKQCQELAWGEHHREECDQVIFLPRRAQIKLQPSCCSQLAPLQSACAVRTDAEST